ncbi:MAG: arylsulfotransferase family protein, partial [Candidatus Thermoplasmatota archaeon]|nr:arylsulfotransferase family protein [Candidatus Thermoplasmatota archaeon]
DQQLFHPHGANWIESGCPGEGHILLFNNKRELADTPKPGYTTYYSSVYEIVPPIDFNGNYHKIAAAYGPISPTWSYYDEENPHDFYSSTLSGAQRLPNGNTLICEGNSGNFFEVTPEKDIVWVYQSPYGPPYDVFNIYRYSPDYPGIKILLE